MAIDALSLLEDGLQLYRRTFRRELWRYYLASAPLAAALLWTWQLNWPADAGSRLGLVRSAALLLTACAALRILGVGAYGRRVLAELSGAHTTRRGADWLAEFGLAAVLILLWWLCLPLLLGIGLFYAAAQYIPLLAVRRLRGALDLALRWWQHQWLLLGLVLIFTGIVFSNLVLTALLLPPLLHGLFGIGGALGFAAASLFLLRSSLFWFAVALLTYLLVDPVIKCTVTVSFQRLQSVREGADLAAAVRRLERPTEGSIAFAPLSRSGFILGLAAPFVSAQVQPGPDGASLQRAINLELRQAVYAWQHPRPNAASGGIGQLFTRLLDALLRPFAILGRGFARAVAAIWHWFTRWLHTSPIAPVAGGRGLNWERWELAFTALCVLMLAGLVLVRRRRRNVAASVLDLESVDVDVATASAADQGELEWFALAVRLQASGQWRLALRAAFLAGLAGLGQRRLLTLRRGSTNREYLEEFSRRVTTLPSGALPDDLRREFGNVIREFNQVWYGGRSVDPEQLDQFVAAQRSLLSHV